jgi:hypothetical protein
MGLDVLSHFAEPVLVPGVLADAGLLFIFLLAAGVTAMAGVGFTLWAAFHILRLIILLLARLVLLPLGRARRAPPQNAINWQACPDPVCRAVNPQHARFCRQCGRLVQRPAQLAA